jgi:hypothetical protein
MYKIGEQEGGIGPAWGIGNGGSWERWGNDE